MAYAALQDASAQSVPSGLHPMPLWQSVLYFGLPALLFRLSIYKGAPALIDLGMSPFDANVASFTVPSAILFALAFGYCKRDGYAGSWSEIKARFRLIRMTGRDWPWAIGALLLTFLSIGAIQQITALPPIKAIPAIAPPDFFPPWNKPGVAFDAGLYANYIGAPLKGN